MVNDLKIVDFIKLCDKIRYLKHLYSLINQICFLLFSLFIVVFIENLTFGVTTKSLFFQTKAFSQENKTFFLQVFVDILILNVN